ncbi:coiled-coil domain-containing protein 15 isoform X2 [Girardinichthys multiradiatus]|uniref:coiled-coil domain-containing protein 15 isoform X2 n=1 Tax=Girardinichthys multiradiatus TaxID=208333 RepID=UPI001FAB4A2B|nr:coiled-coil domain-containing protein 15 isoform X2 [Girardinichthys multiradiatus]
MMSANRVTAPTNRRNKSPGNRTGQHGPSRASKVLAERNQAVVAVGAWVESGQNFLEHPADLALLTEELQAQKRRENEDNLRRFQDVVRQRVAHRAHIRSRQQPRTHPSIIPHRGTPHYQVMTHHMSTNEENIPSGTAAQHSSSPESSEPMRQVRLRLAACRLIQQEKTASDLPGGRWNISPSRHRADAHVQRTEEDVLEEEEQETSHVPLFGSQHECPLVQQKIGGLALLDLNNSHSDLSSNLNLRVPRVLWPMTDQEKMKKQRQSQFLLHRRLAMNTEREQVKENKQLRKHLKRTARIKAEKEKLRQEEEMKLERTRMLAEAKQRLEERELLILEQLKLEEEGAMQLQRRNREEKGNNSARFVEALRAQMKERLSQMKQELPLLCCCASSFWDSHPDTCANNCIFHNNPRAYAKALQSTMVSLDLQ